MGCGSSVPAPQSHGGVQFAANAPAADGERPFATHPPDDTAAASGSDSEQPKAVRRGRSKSVAKLQQISSQRAHSPQADMDRSIDEEVAKGTTGMDGGGGELDSSVVPKRRHRRLSSIYGEFSSQMEEFLERQRQQSGGISSDAPESGSDADGATGKETESQKSLRQMFNTLDLNGDGLVTFEALDEGFRRMGMQSSAQHMRTIFTLADKDQDNRLKWPEFYQFFRAIGSMDTSAAEDADEEAVLQPLTKVGVKRAVHRRGTISVQFLRNYSVRMLAGRPKRIKCIAMSPSRPLFALVDREDKIVYVHDIVSGALMRRLIGHRDSLLGIAFSVDRKLVATASRDAQLNVWDCTVGHQIYNAGHPGVVTACEFSFDGRYLYSGCQDNLVRKMTASKLRLIRVMNRMPQSQLGVIVSLGTQRRQDKQVIISRSCDKCAHVLDAGTLQPLHTLQGHTGMVWHCAFNHDDALAFTQCDKMIKIWDTATFTCRHTLESASLATPYKPNGKRSRVWTTAAFGPPEFGQILFAGCNDTGLYMIRLDTGGILAYLDVKSSIYSIAAGVETRNLLCGDDLGNVFEVQLT